jgi:hypothetical protein
MNGHYLKNWKSVVFLDEAKEAGKGTMDYGMKTTRLARPTNTTA